MREEALGNITRRHFLQKCATGLGALWLGHEGLLAGSSGIERDPADPIAPLAAHFMPKAKHVIYLHMTGAPSQVDLFDYKPLLEKLDGKECPQEYLEGKQFAFITGTPKLMGPQYPFHREKKTGFWVSDRMPHFEQVMDRVCFIRSMKSDQFNHAPAQLLVHTGDPRFGHASVGSWVLYGLGSENQNMPGFVVLLSGGSKPDAGKAAWGSGFLPSVYQGVQCRSEGDPILYLSNPEGMPRDLRGKAIETLNEINQRTYERMGDPATMTRIAQYEMAFRMQLSASNALDISEEPESIHNLYGTQPGQESFANNCVLARRLVERGVRYVQLFDWNWDHHSNLGEDFSKKCKDIDKPMTALLLDLERRGLLDETLVIWGGEFGRTPMAENRGGMMADNPGRDHHVDAFTMWMAGAGVKPGFSYGETDDIGFGVAKNPVSVRDFHATVLNLLGMDHNRLTYPFQGLDRRLTGVEPARVIKEILT